MQLKISNWSNLVPGQNTQLNWRLVHTADLQATLSKKVPPAEAWAVERALQNAERPRTDHLQVLISDALDDWHVKQSAPVVPTPLDREREWIKRQPAVEEKGR